MPSCSENPNSNKIDAQATRVREFSPIVLPDNETLSRRRCKDVQTSVARGRSGTQLENKTLRQSGGFNATLPILNAGLQLAVSLAVGTIED